MAKQTDVRKKAQQQMMANGRKKKKEKTSFREYIKGVKLEMKKVVWPTKSERGAYTATVLVTCIFFAAAFWLIDTGFLAALKGLLGINM